MPVKLNPTSVIKARLGIEPNGKIQRFFQNTCYKAMDRFVPMDKGELRSTVDLSNPNYIVYEMPYARYQYYGIREDGSHKVVNYTTPGTGPYWDRVMWSAKGQDIVKQVQDKLERGG